MTRCTKCGASSEDNPKQKYCGKGDDKDDHHDWKPDVKHRIVPAAEIEVHPNHSLLARDYIKEEVVEKSIWDEILEERAQQDAKWGGEAHDDAHGPLEWVFFITKHAVKAPSAFGSMTQASAWMIFRRQMVRVAALAVAAIESIDRSVEKAKR